MAGKQTEIERAKKDSNKAELKIKELQQERDYAERDAKEAEKKVFVDAFIDSL